jgi:hypothetical protein
VPIGGHADSPRGNRSNPGGCAAAPKCPRLDAHFERSVLEAG